MQAAWCNHPTGLDISVSCLFIVAHHVAADSFGGMCHSCMGTDSLGDNTPPLAFLDGFPLERKWSDTALATETLLLS